MSAQPEPAGGAADRGLGTDTGTDTGTGPAPHADVAGLSYEEARDGLVAVVARLEAGAGSLEESMALWERGEALAARCQQWLDGARERLAQVRRADAAAPGAAPAGVLDEERQR
ncbi:exodeoxyribonuclease VII small subunit [Cellulomonas marina]|uniref:exodeoxyribonuclease VII small subunit n=1 Tax=Cellulomonas marina TaxID=988821 RepID=UPI001A3D9AF2|nr:exodeoxyribonuclease VII small subunit [Cellulomonas marina]GIG28585.1 hypothetical protein Cma02nite_11850 [Cellulomonas marina]